MQAVILAGGLGTRLSELTNKIPKPLVEIGNKPILIHIIEHYIKYGVKDFIIAAGYKQELIKRFFLEFKDSQSNLKISYPSGAYQSLDVSLEEFNVSVIDTGLNTMTGGRIKRLEKYLDNDFFLTYGDGLSNVNLESLNKLHVEKMAIATLTTANIPSRFGLVKVENNLVSEFEEKPQIPNSKVNAGFFVMKKEILQYIQNDQSVLEIDVLPKLASKKKLAAYEHNGFWQAMDSLRDQKMLNNLWENGNPPWST
jgi:glucose-1-phosphate cytidylyltransferase